MKKLFILFLLPILLTSCAVQIESVVDNSLIEKPYSNPLIVIPYEDYSIKSFSNDLKENLEVQFGAEERSVEVFAIELTTSSYTLNPKKEMEQKIKNSISEDGKDLLLIFETTNITFSGGGYRTFNYLVTGIDTHTGKEVWKAKFVAARGSFGAGKMAEKAAESIFQKLKTDKVI